MFLCETTDRYLIVYKKDRRVVHRVTTSGTTSDNEWQRVTTSGTTSDNEWQRVVQRVTMSGTTYDNDWQWVVILANFSFFQIREKPSTKHPKENFKHWRGPL